MAYSVDNIVPTNAIYVPAGLAFANFGSATLIAPEADLPVGFNVDTYRDYSSTAGLEDDGFLNTTETYKAALRWFGSTPSPSKLRVWGRDSTDTNYTQTLDKMRNVFWWFITFVTTDVLDTLATVIEVAEWCNANKSMFPNTSNEAGLITPSGASSAKDLSALGYRFCYTTYHPTDRYAAIPLMAWFAAVNYTAPNSVITGQYKTITNVATTDLNETETNAATADDVKAGFITDIDLQGEFTPSRYVNSVTHSANGESIADVFDSEAFINAIKTTVFNTIANQPTKLQQTPRGQQAIITACQGTCEDFITNGYLGPRNYLNPDNGLEEFTAGYEILTKPEDILDLSAGDRAEHKSAPMVIRIFRAGAIWIAPITLYIY